MRSTSAMPNYDGLVALLPTLRRLVDAAGLVTLEPGEAEQIRNLGFPAQEGLWRCPRLPLHLVEGNPLLEPLSDTAGAFQHPQQLDSDPIPAATTLEHSAEHVEPMNGRSQAPVLASKSDCAAILAAVERAGGTVERRILQKKLWRLKAQQFNRTIQALVERGQIRVEGKMLVAEVAERIPQPLLRGVPPAEGDVPPSGGDVPQTDPGVDLSVGPDQVNGFREVVIPQEIQRKFHQDGPESEELTSDAH